MKTLIFVLIFFSVLVSPQYSQTQLLRVGNATGFGEWPFGSTSADITVDKVTINGKQYLKRKLGWIEPLVDYTTSYERIEGDSAYYVLSSTNTDSLAFNFNWPVGTITYSYNVGNIIYERRIDSIEISSFLIPQDTLYHILLYSINTATGDTTHCYGSYCSTIHSKKLGRTDYGIFISLQGAKIDGVRYGDILPYPEEIVFYEDSLYIQTLADSGSTKIINTSEIPVRIDSIISVGSFYGYWGEFSKPGFLFPFYLIQTFPNQQWGDTLGIIIPPHDSINVSFSNVDLCPICDYEVQEYFKDTLRFVFTFTDGNIYSFSKSIPISGEGYPSDIEKDDVLISEFELQQNYPNPFNPSTSIQYAISSKQFISLRVYDVLGNEVATLVNEYRDAGKYELEFNAEKLSSGVYYYQLRAGRLVQTKKMIYLK